MAEDPKELPVEDTTPVTINADQYRSMILSKLRADIATKQALLTAAATAKVADLDGMSYWKMAYWKMKYWKMGGGERFMFAVDPE